MNEVAKNMPLEEHLCFAVYAASHAIQQRYREYLTSWGITYPQYLVLVALWDADDNNAVKEGLTVKELGERLHLDSGTLSPLLKRLEQHEFITKQRSETDNRRVLIRPTVQAENLRTKVGVLRDCLVSDAGLSIAELQELRNLAQKIAAGLQERNATVATEYAG
ncbi:MAG: MarR family transcriptional regulator [Corynebacterium sp.]|nr:MarR family transcriptional regulator [Corynebacterium sp.]